MAMSAWPASVMAGGLSGSVDTVTGSENFDSP